MRVRAFVSALTAAVCTAMALAAAPAQAAPVDRAVTAASFGPYLFKNDYSHLCMDVAFGSTADGARIQQWDCYGGTPEQWRLDEISVINGVHYYAFVNVNSGKCLEVPNGSKDWGVELVQWTCWSGDMQQWALYRAGGNSVTIRNMRSGLCVDVKNWGGAGAALQQWDCNNLSVQTWQF